MIRPFAPLFLVACVATACGVDLDVGDLDGGVQPVGDLCAPDLPSNDCTAGHPACTFDQDCGGGLCNDSTSRCFDPNDSCNGTPCIFYSDCGVGESCNDALRRCFKVAERQMCRPCTFDDDCGSTRCKTFDHVCE